MSSIAFPLLGAQKGGIDSSESMRIMTKYLPKCEIDVEIWNFDPSAKDDLYEEFKSIFTEIGLNYDTIIFKQYKHNT